MHQIEPTNHCPYSCIMCPRTAHMNRPLGYMDMAVYQKVIDEVSTYSEPVRSREIELFHFGESLLHPQIHEMTSYASGKYLKISLSVNAPLLTPATAERILDSRPHRLIISLDAHDENTYKRIRGRNSDYHAAVSNIRHLCALMKNARPLTKVSLRIIKLKINEPSLQKFKEEWEDKGISVEIRQFFPWTEKEIVPLGEVEKYPPFMPCPFPWQYLVVQWDGTVVPCCRDYNSVNRMGNVKQSTLKGIWNGSMYSSFREQHRGGDYSGNEFCRRCMDIFSAEPSDADN